jgi:prevent-host-death family protein
MKSMTATQAARNFASLLDAVEHGEAVVITRDGVTVGRFVPERRTTADRLKDALRKHPADPAFADDIEAAQAELRASFSDGVHAWPDA